MYQGVDLCFEDGESCVGVEHFLVEANITHCWMSGVRRHEDKSSIFSLKKLVALRCC